MTYDFSAIKIPTFTGINDTPVKPTASKAGNGSHLIKQFNDLVSELENTLNSLSSTVDDSSQSFSYFSTTTTQTLTGIGQQLSAIRTDLNNLAANNSSSGGGWFYVDSSNQYDPLFVRQQVIARSGRVILPEEKQPRDSVVIVNARTSGRLFIDPNNSNLMGNSPSDYNFYIAANIHYPICFFWTEDDSWQCSDVSAIEVVAR